MQRCGYCALILISPSRYAPYQIHDDCATQLRRLLAQKCRYCGGNVELIEDPTGAVELTNTLDVVCIMCGRNQHTEPREFTAEELQQHKHVAKTRRPIHRALNSEGIWNGPREDRPDKRKLRNVG